MTSCEEAEPASIWSWEVGCEARIGNCAWIVSWEAGCGAGSLDCELGGGMRRWELRFGAGRWDVGLPRRAFDNNGYLTDPSVLILHMCPQCLA